jgi:hypothetical protein
MAWKFETGKKQDVNGGDQYLHKFDNNYGASVVRHDFSYGGNDGLWELAVIKYEDNGSWNLTYDTPITDDVLGYLTEEEIDEILEQIKALP